MTRELKKNEKIQIILFSISLAIIIFALILIMHTMEMFKFFTQFVAIGNILGKYLIVILTMSTGVMLFSNVAATLENKKLRNGLSIGITTFATVLTIPLVYDFIAIFPYQATGKIDVIGGLLGTDLIAQGFQALISSEAGLYVVYTVMMIVSIVFISFPLLTTTLLVKYEKSLKIGKQANGKFGIGLQTLPVVARQQSESEAASGCACGCREYKLEVAADEEDK